MVSTKIGTTTLKSSSRIPLNKKRICKKERSYQTGSSSTCMLSLPWKEIVPSLPMDLLRTPRKYVSGAKKSCCCRRYESTPCKLGEFLEKSNEQSFVTVLSGDTSLE